MNKLIIITLFTFFGSLAFSNGDPYTDAMKAGMDMFEKSQSAEDFLAAANQFERISKVATDQWHPAYYTALTRSFAASMINDAAQKDNLLDAAESFLDKLSELEHDKSEVVALQGFIYMLRIAVDPATRGQEYSMKSGVFLQRAIALDPNNPRALFMQAQLNYGTAQFFGSDASEACEANDRAIKIFEAQENLENRDEFAPSWGKSMAMNFQQQCNG